MKKLYLFIFFLILLSTIFSMVIARAQESTLEGDYPKFDNVPGGLTPPKSSKVYLPNYIRYLYYGSIILGGIIVLTVLMLGGLRFLTSAGNPSVTSDARNQILSGFIGLILILGSYIILKEINPDLIKLEVPIIESGQKGLMFYNTENCAGLGPAAGRPSYQDISDDIRYRLMNGSGSTDMDTDKNTRIFPRSFYSLYNSEEDGLRIELYGNEDCTGSAQVKNVKVGDCIDFKDSGGNSYEVKCVKFVWRTPGIWLFNKLNNGNLPNPLDLPLGWNIDKDYTVIQRSQDIPDGFTDNIKAIAIMADEERSKNYGVILHNLPGGLRAEEKGWIHIYLPHEDISACKMAKGSDGSNERGLYLCGPFSTKYYGTGRANSATVFTLPNIGESIFTNSIALYRQVRYSEYMVDKKGSKPVWYNALYNFTPKTSLLTDNDKVILYKPSKVAYIQKLTNEKWQELKDEQDHEVIITSDGSSDGVSSIKMPDTARYILALYKKDYDDLDQINKSTKGDGARANVISGSIPNLKDIQMDDEVGTIIILKYSIK